jgi:hypothetical protein
MYLSQNYINNHFLNNSVAAWPPWGSARELSLSVHMAGGPPPHSWPWGGWRHHVTAGTTVASLLHGMGGFSPNHLSESLNPFIHTGGPHRRRSFHRRLRQWHRWHGSWNVETTLYMYFFASEYVTARLWLTLRETSATPCGPGYHDTSRSGFFKVWNWSLRPTRLTLVLDVPPATLTCAYTVYVPIALLYVKFCPGRLQRLGTTPTLATAGPWRQAWRLRGARTSTLLVLIILLATPWGH